MDTENKWCWPGQEGLPEWGTGLYETPKLEEDRNEDRNGDEREQPIIYKNEQEKVKYLQL